MRRRAWFGVILLVLLSGAELVFMNYLALLREDGVSECPSAERNF